MKMHLKRIVAGVSLMPNVLTKSEKEEVEALFAKSTPKLISFFKSLFEDWNANPLVAKFDSLDSLRAYVQSPKNLVRADGEEIKVINQLYKLIDRLLTVRLVTQAEEKVRFDRRWTQLSHDYLQGGKLDSQEINDLLDQARKYQQLEQDPNYFIAELELLLFSGESTETVAQVLKKWPIDVQTNYYSKFEMLLLLLLVGQRDNFNLFFELSEKRILSDVFSYPQEARKHLLNKLQELKDKAEAEFEKLSKKSMRLAAS